jgi:2-methylcitrate dehydratase PrpD
VETVSLARVRVVNAASATARCDVRGVARREVMGAIGARALVADIIMFAFRRSAENAEGK